MTRRGQLVLLAAVALAVALLPLVTAVGQLAYHPDGQGRVVDPHPVAASEQVLDRAAADAASGLPREFGWPARERAAAAARQSMAPALAALNRSQTDAGTVLAVTFNETRANAWARANCPGGPARRFGPCSALEGVVLQERSGRTHLVAVAVDLRATGQDAQWRMTAVIRPR